MSERRPPSAEAVVVREARGGDARGIARVHVASWRSTYSGVLSEEVLAGLSAERRAETWERTIARGFSPRGVFVAETEAEGVVGFASCGLERRKVPGIEAEIFALYVLDAFQRRGIGRRLVGAAVDRLLGADLTSMLAWVWSENPAVAFYRALGGEPIAEQVEVIGGCEVHEVAMAWRSTERMRAI